MKRSRLQFKIRYSKFILLFFSFLSVKLRVCSVLFCVPSSPLLRQLMFIRINGRLNPVPQPQPTENVGDVVFDRAFADHKLLGNFTVGGTSGNQSQHFQFTVGEIVFQNSPFFAFVRKGISPYQVEKWGPT